MADPDPERESPDLDLDALSPAGLYKRSPNAAWVAVSEIDHANDATWCPCCRSATGILDADGVLRLACTVCDWSVPVKLAPSAEHAGF